MEDIVDRSDDFLVAEVVELSCGFDFVGVLLPFLRRCCDAGVSRAQLGVYVA